LLRERADLRNSPEEYRQDIQAAGLWLQKAEDTKKIKAQQFTMQRIRVAPDVEAAKLIKRIEPVSPEPAIQGTVRLTAVIGKDGRVQNLRLLSGQPRLATAAMEAVKQWLYRPTLIGGQLVEVVTQINVNFPAAK
jgi:TonB family protein